MAKTSSKVNIYFLIIGNLATLVGAKHNIRFAQLSSHRPNPILIQSVFEYRIADSTKTVPVE